MKYLKRALSVILCVVAASTLMLNATAAETKSIAVSNNIKIIINGEELIPVDVNGNAVDVFVYNGTTYAPLRALTEALGATVGYDQVTRTATVDYNPHSGVDRTYLNAMKVFKYYEDLSTSCVQIIASLRNIYFEVTNGLLDPNEALETLAYYSENLPSLYTQNEDASYMAQELSASGFTYYDNDLAVCAMYMKEAVGLVIEANGVLTTYIQEPTDEGFSAFYELSSYAEQYSYPVQSFANQTVYEFLSALTY